MMALKIISKICLNGVRSFCSQDIPSINIKGRFSKPLSQIALLLHEELKHSDSNVFKKNWAEYRKELSETINVDENHVDHIIFDICDFHQRPDVARDYIKFLQAHNIPMNLSIVGKYLNTYRCRTSLTEVEENEILGIYDDLRKKYPHLDATTARRCVPALCLTKKWLKKGEELFEMLKIIDKPTVSVYQDIICAAFRNHNPAIAWKYLHLLQPKSPDENIYLYHLNYLIKTCTNKSDFVAGVEAMFEYWHQYRIIPRQSQIELYMKQCSQFNWKGHIVNISNEGICNNCSGGFKMVIAEDEFVELRESMLKKNIILHDPYTRTTPHELNNFMDFVQCNTFDIVIDALNVFYSGTLNKREMNNIELNIKRQKKVASVVKHFVKQNKKILVLGRKHIWRLKSSYLDYISQKALVYKVEDSSEDDPFVIYAAMSKGLGTKFLSRDLMRQHKSLLKNAPMQRLFNQWLWTHQYKIRFHQDNIGFKVIEPSPILLIPQRINNSWHIPVFASDAPMNTDFHSPPLKWVCFQHLDDWRPS